MTLAQRLCYLSGMLYYVALAVAPFINGLPALFLVYILPGNVKWFNIFFIIPSLLMVPVILSLWSRHSYSLNALKIYTVQSYAALFALKDSLFNTEQAWIPSGGKSTKTARFQQARAILITYTIVSLAILYAGCAWRMVQGYAWYDFLPIILVEFIQVPLNWQFMMNRD